MQRNAVIVGAIFFVAGWTLGRRMRDEPVSGLVMASPGKIAATPKPALVPSSSSASGTPIVSTAISPQLADRLGLLVELRKQVQQSGFRANMVMGGQLNQDFVRLFDLTLAEQQALRTAIQTATDQMNRIEASVAKIEPRADGSVMILVSPYPREGGGIYDQFMTQLNAVLGPERIAYARELHAIDFDRTYELHQFGLWQMELEVRPPSGDLSASSSGSVDAATGVAIQKGYTSLPVLKLTQPYLYEKLRLAGQLPAGGHP